MSFTHAIGYAMISMAIINIFQASYLIPIEPINWWLLGDIIIGSALGAWLGTNILFNKGNYWVKVAAVVLMVFMGISMLISI